MVLLSLVCLWEVKKATCPCRATQRVEAPAVVLTFSLFESSFLIRCPVIHLQRWPTKEGGRSAFISMATSSWRCFHQKKLQHKSQNDAVESFFVFFSSDRSV